MPKKNYKEDIIEAAKKELAEKGYANLNMRAIANLAGIKAASIYNHFSNKDEIIYHLILEGRLMLAHSISEELNGAEGLKAKIEAYFDAFINFGFKKREYYNIMFMQEYPKEAMEKVKEKIAREIEPGLKTLAELIEEYTNRCFTESLVLAESFFHILHGHISLCILNREDFLFDKVATRKRIREIVFLYLENCRLVS
jgi:AcrR family transcriptional regulator